MRKTVRERIKLTDAKVRKFAPPTDRPSIIVWDDEEKRFGVRITKNGVASWIVRYKKDGKAQQFTIGRCDALPVRSFNHRGEDIGARQRAKKKLEELEQGAYGVDLKRQKDAARITFAEAKAEYIANHRTRKGEPLRPNSIRDIKNCLPEWNEIRVAKIEREMCRSKFDEISLKTPIKANRDFKNLSAVLNRVRELTATEDGDYVILRTNPVTHLFRRTSGKYWNPTKSLDTRIKEEKIGSVFNLVEELAQKNENNSLTNTCADLSLFLLFTGCRIGEARSLTWDRVDIESSTKTFHIPKDLAKNHNAITLPISSALTIVLKRRFMAKKENSDFVFPNHLSKTGYVGDPRALFKKISECAGTHIHPHALRRTFEDISQLVGVSSDQRRQLLNHSATDVHGESYSNNLDPKFLLPAVDKIGNWVVEQGAIASGQNVVEMEFSQ